MKRLGFLVFVLLLMLAVCWGCGVQLGSDTQQTSKPTLGEELVDLKKAKDTGAISEQEYQKLKESLKKRYE